MMRRLTAWSPVVLLALLAALTFWLDREVQPPEAGPSGKLRHDPDYIVDGLAATQIGVDGRPRHTLRAKRMTHYPDDDTTLLEAPTLVSFRGGATAMTVSAKNARLSANGKTVDLEEEVRLVRAARDGRGVLIVETSRLHVEPDNHTARTDQPVRIYDANMLITAVGLESNSETRILKLLSTVRGQYDKNPKAR